MGMYDPAQAYRDLLVAAGVGVWGATSGWGIYIGNMPDAPEKVILVNATGGRDPMPQWLVNYPSVQVFVRGAKSGYQEARDKISACRDALLGYTGGTLGGDTYRSINQMGEIAYLGQDENTRPTFSANFWSVVLPASGTYRQPIT